MRILFMGTPDFALFSLKRLADTDNEIIGVVTQPDKPCGRGYTLTPPPVKAFATEKGIPVYQPDTLRGEEFAALLEELDPEIIIVVAYGKILPENVINYPKYGCVNVHGSLLPEYRGAAPMQRAIIDGKKTTGVTIMYMDVGLDTGDMILSREIVIEENDNFETVHDKLGEVGAAALTDALTQIQRGIAPRIKQDDSLSTYASKIERSDREIDFGRDALSVHNQIRGLSPVPLAFTHTKNGKLLKVVASEIVDYDGECKEACGSVISLSDGKITVACGRGKIAITALIPEGKSRMRASDYINGRQVAAGDIFGGE